MLATAATFLRSCVVQALSLGDGSRHSLHASAYYREYNKDFLRRCNKNCTKIPHNLYCFTVPITDTWRSELRELCAKAGLIAEEPVVVPIPASAPATPARKTKYSGEVL